MHDRDTAFDIGFDDHRGARLHRFMESADIAAVFRESFGPLRAHVRRGMTIEGQVFAIEMDPCIPGELLGTAWIPPISHGFEDMTLLAHTLRRRHFFQRLLAQPRPEALFAYIGERQESRRGSLLMMEVVSADGVYAVDYTIQRGAEWHQCELLPAPHRRLGPLALA